MRRVAPLAVLLAACGGGGGGSSGGDHDAAPVVDAARVVDAATAPADAAAATDAAASADAAPPVTEDVDWTPQVPAALAADIPDAPTDRPADCHAEWISVLRGWVAAPGGAPVAGAKAQLCVHLSPSETLLCLRPGDTDADGVFTIQVPENARCITRAAMRVLLPGSGKATTYCPLDVTGAAPVLRVQDPYVVFQTRPAVSLPPEGDDHASRPVGIDDGLVIDLTPELFYSGGGEYADLGGRRVPTTARGVCFVPADKAAEGLYAFYPEGSLDAPGAPVHLPNTTGLPAGAKVELSVLGGLDCKRADGTSIPEATWDDFGTATVSADGATIDSDANVGLPCLTWLGYRRLP
jgi:hypothetical protein